MLQFVNRPLTNCQRKKANESLTFYSPYKIQCLWRDKPNQKPLGVASYQIQEVVDRTVAELELNNEEDEV